MRPFFREAATSTSSSRKRFLGGIGLDISSAVSIGEGFEDSAGSKVAIPSPWAGELERFAGVLRSAPCRARAIRSARSVGQTRMGDGDFFFTAATLRELPSSLSYMTMALSSAWPGWRTTGDSDLWIIRAQHFCPLRVKHARYLRSGKLKWFHVMHLSSLC